MKRFHVHVSVKNLDESVRFITILFAAQPRGAPIGLRQMDD